MRPNHATLIAFLCGTLIVSGCKDKEEPLQEQPFAGTWKILQAVKDDTSMDQWMNVQLRLEQNTNTSGDFTVEVTPNELVWPASGAWHMDEDNEEIIREDNVWIYFVVVDQTLILQMNISSENGTCDPEDSACILVVEGEWTFVLEKI
jgi:hypothetical protein